MKQAILYGALLALAIGCQSPKLGRQSAAVGEDQDLTIHICGHYLGSTNSGSLDCAATPQAAYSATDARRTSECHGNVTCLNSGIYLLITTPTPPVPASFMQAYATAARQIESFMAPKDLGGYQRTLEELTKGAKLIGKTETENLRRDYEAKLNQATKDKITGLGSAAFGAQQATLVRTRDAVHTLTAINNRYTPIVNQLADQFLTLVTRYQTLRSAETAAIDDLTAAVSEASLADTVGGAAALTHVIAVARSESSTTNDFAVAASQFRAELEARAGQYSDEIAPYRNLMQELALPALDFATHSDVSVDSMVSYAEQRDTRMADAAERVIVQIRLRLHALQVAAANEATRQTFADAALLRSSTEFLATANARVAEILRTPDKSPVLKIS